MCQSAPEPAAPTLEQLIDSIASVEPGAPIPPPLLIHLRQLRAQSSEAALVVDQALVSQIVRLRQGLEIAREHLEALEVVLGKLRSTPWHSAVFLGRSDDGRDLSSATVSYAGAPRVVGIDPEADLDGLAVGDDVFLGPDLNVIVGRAGIPLPRTGETATFEQRLFDGRLVLKHRDDLFVVRPAESLDPTSLTVGARVRWDRATGLAYEALAAQQESPLFIEETPSDTFDGVGGLDVQIRRLCDSVSLHMNHADTAARYGVRPLGSVLLVGPPGTGKTMLARALANWLAHRSPSRRSRFMNIKPGEFLSMWYGESERNVREAFAMARRIGEAEPDTPVVMFLDEIDSLGRARGQTLGHVDDRVLMSLMAELEGFAPRGNVLVVAATNRRDLLDSGLRSGRLNLVLDIPRPTMAAAAAIFEKHFPVSAPYAGGAEGDGPDSRRALLSSAVSRLYAPNGEGDLAIVMFRDGRSRSIRARDVMSGARIANIARIALERAALRDVAGGPPGLTATDVHAGVGEELAAAVAVLTPANIHMHVSDLPQDLAVVRVEPVHKTVREPHRYRRVA